MTRSKKKSVKKTRRCRPFRRTRSFRRVSLYLVCEIASGKLEAKSLMQAVDGVLRKMIVEGEVNARIGMKATSRNVVEKTVRGKWPSSIETTFGTAPSQEMEISDE